MSPPRPAVIGAGQRGAAVRSATVRGPTFLPLVEEAVFGSVATGDTAPPGVVMFLGAR